MNSIQVLATLLLLSFVSSSLGQGDDLNGEWLSKTAMPTARSDMAVSVAGNAILVLGGCSAPQTCPDPDPYCFCPEITNKVEAYFPDEDRWATLPPMPRSRFRHGSEVVGTKLYIFGGRDVDDNLVTEVDVLDIATEVWTTLAPEKSFVNATSDFATFVYNNTIYVIGGYLQDYTVVSTGSTFSPNKPNAVWEYETVSAMNFPRGDTCNIEVGGTVYLIGGYEDLDACIPLDSVEIYDINSNKWELGPSGPSRGGDRACGLLQGKFNVFGGEIKDKTVGCSKFSDSTDEVFEYDPATKEWTKKAPMPRPRFRFVANYWKGRGHEALYVFGGQGDLVSTTDPKTYPVVNTVDAWRYFISGGERMGARWGMIVMGIAVAMTVFMM